MIIIEARRWFQKSFGNTYHSVMVRLGNGEEHTINFRYGYGENYLQTAWEILKDQGVKFREYSATGIKKKVKTYIDFLSYKRTHKNNIYVNVQNVTRRKDLHNGGKN